MAFDVNSFNVILTGFCFLLLFSAFLTASQTSQNVLEAASKETTADVGVGYISLSILYASFCICNWLAPSVISALGEKFTMFLGSICYLIFVATFMEPRAWSVYIGSLICGFGAAIIWTAQGAFVTKCSTEANVNRHFSIFWALFQCSQIAGGLYVYLFLAGIPQIEKSMRLQLFAGLLGCGALGGLLFLGLRPPRTISHGDRELLAGDYPSESTVEVGDASPLLAPRRSLVEDLSNSIRLLKSRTLLCILVASGFTGVNNTLFSGLFASCIGHTLALGSWVKSFIGLTVVFIGIGEIAGSVLINLRRWIVSPGLVTLFGYSSALLAAFLCFIMLPAESPIKETYAPTYLQPRVEALMFVALLFGMIDATWNTQISVLIGDVYRAQKEDLPTAFALYRCLQAIMSAITFAYSNQLFLQWHLLIYVIWASLGLATFSYAYWKNLEEQANLRKTTTQSVSSHVNA